MTKQVVVTARAQADALDAFVWLAERSPDAAERWFLALQEAIEGLSTMPERHPVAEEESELLGVALGICSTRSVEAPTACSSPFRTTS